MLKLKRPIDKLEDTFRNSLNLCWEGTTWMNNQIVERYLRATFKAPGFVQGKHLLVWDCFNAPISADTKKVFRSLQMQTPSYPVVLRNGFMYENIDITCSSIQCDM